jgi:hypothetical protein
MTQYLVAIRHPDDYHPSVGPEAMSKIRIEDPLFSSILFGVLLCVYRLGWTLLAGRAPARPLPNFVDRSSHLGSLEDVSL